MPATTCAKLPKYVARRLLRRYIAPRYRQYKNLLHQCAPLPPEVIRVPSLILVDYLPFLLEVDVTIMFDVV